MGDYHPEMFGQVEARWRTAPPPQHMIDEALKAVCMDCNINVSVEEHPLNDGEYIIVRAHDATCPWLIEYEKEKRG